MLMITALGLQYIGAQETKRSNLAKEAETKRSNLENERIKASTLDETKRSNLVNEAETMRSHLANESETKRSNMVREDISQRTLDESIRSNIAKETESRRHNLQTENVARGQLEEAIRSDRVQEWLKQQMQDHNISVDRANLDIAQKKLTDQLLNSEVGRKLEKAQTDYTQGKNVREYVKSATDTINSVFDFISKRGKQLMEAIGNVLK